MCIRLKIGCADGQIDDIHATRGKLALFVVKLVKNIRFGILSEFDVSHVSNTSLSNAVIEIIIHNAA